MFEKTWNKVEGKVEEKEVRTISFTFFYTLTCPFSKDQHWCSNTNTKNDPLVKGMNGFLNNKSAVLHTMAFWAKEKIVLSKFPMHRHLFESKRKAHMLPMYFHVLHIDKVYIFWQMLIPGHI